MICQLPIGNHPRFGGINWDFCFYSLLNPPNQQIQVQVLGRFNWPVMSRASRISPVDIRFIAHLQFLV